MKLSTALMIATLTPTTRAHTAPWNRKYPATTSTPPASRWIQPQVVTLNEKSHFWPTMPDRHQVALPRHVLFLERCHRVRAVGCRRPSRVCLRRSLDPYVGSLRAPIRDTRMCDHLG